MRKKRFDNRQIAEILRERDLGASMQELSAKYQVSQATLYAWRAEHRHYTLMRDAQYEWLSNENRRLRAQLFELTIEANRLREILRSMPRQLNTAAYGRRQDKVVPQECD